MQGLELSKRYFEEYGLPMLEQSFPDLLPYLAIGLVGKGSECFGYDDPTSQDHDFGPGFCIFLPDESVVDRASAFRLERAYAKLPREYMGVCRDALPPADGLRHGVVRTADFYRDAVGVSDGCLSAEEWLSIPEYALAQATNGAVFCDAYGEFTRIRARLLQMPDDVLKKRLAGSLFLMAQAGQYNYPRCLSRGETGAAQLALYEFAQQTMRAVFLLNRRYMPYYKWSFRALRACPRLSELADAIERLISSDNSQKQVSEKLATVERISSCVCAQLREDGLSDYVGHDLQGHAVRVNDSICDPSLRTLHLLAGV